MPNTSVITHKSEYMDVIQKYLESELSPQREFPIVLNGPLIFEEYVTDYPEKYILYNPEQLSRPIVLQKLLEIIQKYSSSIVEIWDYSTANVEILLLSGISAKYVPITITNTYAFKLQTYRYLQDPVYDVGFSGTISERRMKILQGLRDKGVTVNIVTSFGNTRDRELSKCRVILNIHYAEDYSIFESVRCEPWLHIGSPVLSEESWDNDPRAINVPYDQLVDRTVELLAKLRG